MRWERGRQRSYNEEYQATFKKIKKVYRKKLKE